MAAGLVAAVQRYAIGLGATTNLADTFPWGLWIGFDILVGVGLAAGGFTIAATVYIFNIERFRPILRPTILTAFLGYLLVIAGLMVDLGRPWAIWHAHDHVEPPLGHVRSGMVRHALHDRAGAGVQPGGPGAFQACSGR